MGCLKVWVDGSYKPDKQCCAGYVYHNPEKNKRVVEASEVYEADNNNTAEILAVYFALRNIYEKYNITQFKVYCDSIIGASMLHKDKKISKKLLNKHPVLKFVLEYFKEHGIDIVTEHVPRTDYMMKMADRKSKEFRKKEEL